MKRYFRKISKKMKLKKLNQTIPIEEKIDKKRCGL